MLWLWILLGILIAFFLFCLVRVGLYVAFEGSVVADVTIGPLRIQVAPAKPGKKAKEKKKPKEKKEQKPGALDKLKKIPKPTLEDIKSAYRTLWPPTKRALRRTRRGILVNPLELSLTLGGKRDPAGAAELYGDSQAAVWMAMPVLEQLLKIPHPHIHTGVDFERERPEVRGRVGISIRIGTLLLVGLGIGIPALKWFWRYWKRHKNDPQKDAEKQSETDQANQPDHQAA